MKTLILILACPGVSRSRFVEEVREIENTIRRALTRDLFEIRVRTAVCSGDIRRALAEERPQIVHICGDVKNGSLVLERDGNCQFISSKGLAALLKLHDYVKCVLINACHSSTLAAAISSHIRYVIAINQSVERNAAIVFIQGFYDGISYINSNDRSIVQRAFEEGKVALELENLLEDSVPRLWESNFEYKVELKEKGDKEIYLKY